MKFINKILRVILFTSFLGIAYGQPSSYPLAAGPPAKVTQGGTNVIGSKGNTKYYYFVIARYNIGTSAQSTVFQVSNAPTILSVSNYVVVTWNPPQSSVAPNSYDVIRLTTPNFPSLGMCISCLVASATTATSFNDVSNSTLGDYTLSAASSAAMNIYLDNIRYSTPALRFTSSPTGTFAPDATMYIDFSETQASIPTKVVSTIPTTCNKVGQMFWVTSATAGENLYGCTSINTLTQLSGAGNAFVEIKTGMGNPNTGLETCDDPTTGMGKLTEYFDETDNEWWICIGTNTWELQLTTNGIGTMEITGDMGTNPSAPATGQATLSVNNTNKNLVVTPDSGALSYTVQSSTCAGSQFVNGMGADGILDCGSPSSGPSFTTAGLVWPPFGYGTGGTVTSDVCTLASPCYWQFINYFSSAIIDKIVLVGFSGEASKDGIVYLMDSSCNLIANSTSTTNTNTGPGNTSIPFTISSPPTITAGIYYIGIATNCTSCTFVVNGVNNGQILATNTETIKQYFHGNTAATQVGGAGTTITAPATCGTRTALSGTTALPLSANFYNN